jgi:hypothetical protein
MQALPSSEPSAYPFSSRELERLTIYRAAIDAGFFTDRVPEPSESVWHLPELSAAA